MSRVKESYSSSCSCCGFFFLKLRVFSVGLSQLPPAGQHCPGSSAGSVSSRTRLLGSLEYIFCIQIQLQADNFRQKRYQRWRLTTAGNKHECRDLKNSELTAEIAVLRHITLY